MATDFTKAPEQIIIDLVNDKNPSLGLTTSLVTFGAPAVYSGTEARNTKLTLSAASGSGYSGDRDIFYNRVAITDVPGTRSLDYTVGNAVNVSDLIPEINARYGINLTAADYVDAVLPTFTDLQPNETKPFDLVIATGSLVFTGTLSLTLSRNDIPLTDAIPNNILDGLTYVQPT